MIFVGAALLAVLGVLLGGLWALARPGQSARRSQRFMRWRVVLQGMAVILLVWFFLNSP